VDPGRDIVLVSGATGKQGGAVARHLLEAGLRVRAMTRKPDGDAARALAARGAEVVRADLDDAASLERAAAGTWGVFAVQNSWEAGVVQEEAQGKRLAEVARRQGVQHFVYSSVGSAHLETGIPHFDSKWRIEQAVRALKFPSHVILRPVFFMENFLGPGFGLREGKLRIALPPDRTLQMLAVDDVGKYAARAFIRHIELAGYEIDLAGDELTMPRAADVLTEALGRQVSYEQQPLAEVRAFSEDYALMLEWFARVGYSADIAALERNLDVEPTRLREWAVTHRQALGTSQASVSG
jgi:uncharacterized protein YbjT (DUF2867 family)